MQSEFFSGGPVASHQILPYLNRVCLQAQKIELAVSFVRLSGVRLLLPLFKKLSEENVSIRLLCGSYMGISEPAALRILLYELGDRISLRLFNDPVVSFHPKCWIFHKKEEIEVLIGSSNLSRSALTSGIEWNYAFSSKGNEKSVEKILDSFEDLWSESIKLDQNAIDEYQLTRQNFQTGQWMDQLAAEDEPADRESLPDRAEPNAVQIEALYKLEETRGKGEQRALVQAATGTGKTFLAAFDSRTFPRVLFIAHRQEILLQAAKAFHIVRPDDSIGFVEGDRRELDRDLVFASVQTLAKPSVLNEEVLPLDAFDYVVVDEFHHAAASQYKKILSYLHPKFLLGLTATPYRLDGKDLYALCDYNVPYQMNLFDAIAQGYLSPFRYYGIYDPTDYKDVKSRGMHFDAAALEQVYAQNTERANLIHRHYRKHPSDRGLGFCITRNHARFMARYFRSKGIPCASVVSNPDLSENSTDMDREKALKKLANGELRILFTVDLFNEGTDIPNLDLVMFLRPTESAVVYLQQLGRGLRKAPGKEYLTVLDFIGNYKTAAFGPSLISSPSIPDSAAPSVSGKFIPSQCVVDFDLELIDLLENLKKRKQTPLQTMQEMVYLLKESLGHLPSRMQLWDLLDDDDLAYCRKNSKISPFQNYLGFLDKMDLLDEKQEELQHSPGGKFIHLLETTRLSRVYKLAVLEVLRQSLINRGTIASGYSKEEVLAAWKTFFSKAGRWIDLDAATRHDFEKIKDSSHLRKIQTMPVKHLLASFDGLIEQNGDDLLTLNDSLIPYLDDPFFQKQVLDILDYRTEDYYASRFEDSVRKSVKRKEESAKEILF